MKTKMELIMLALQIELCWLFIKAWRKMAESYFEKGGSFTSERSIAMYKHLQRCCNRVMILSYKYKITSSVGTCSTEQRERQVVTK